MNSHSQTAGERIMQTIAETASSGVIHGDAHARVHAEAW
jgi:RIO-like serine/threonine protein kinase